jgi:hypothetical protein
MIKKAIQGAKETNSFRNDMAGLPALTKGAPGRGAAIRVASVRGFYYARARLCPPTTDGGNGSVLRSILWQRAI